MSFSPNGKYLVSVSRDRKWSLFGVKDDGKMYDLLATSDAKNNIHTRVIWCCTWTPDSLAFATGSRDGKIGFWTPIKSDSENEFVTVKAITRLELSKESVTALAFAPVMKKGFYILAVGLDNGKILLYRQLDTVVESLKLEFREPLSHDLTVKRLVFRPKVGRAGVYQEGIPKEADVLQLASCGSDHAFKIFDLFC